MEQKRNWTVFSGCRWGPLRRTDSGQPPQRAQQRQMWMSATPPPPPPTRRTPQTLFMSKRSALGPSLDSFHPQCQFLQRPFFREGLYVLPSAASLKSSIKKTKGQIAPHTHEAKRSTKEIYKKNGKWKKQMENSLFVSKAYFSEAFLCGEQLAGQWLLRCKLRGRTLQRKKIIGVVQKSAVWLISNEIRNNLLSKYLRQQQKIFKMAGEKKCEEEAR